MNCKKIQQNRAFTIVEIMVALVILAVGLLGMAGMTVVVMRGSRGAEDLANATNVCQQKIEELKDIAWSDLGNPDGSLDNTTFGRPNAGMVQEVNLNSQGMTWAAFCTQQSGITGSACEGQSASCGTLESSNCPSNNNSAGCVCKRFVDQAGPYKYSRTFAICDGENYPGLVTSAAMGSAANPSSFQYSAAPNCEVNPNNNTTRAAALACEGNDILTTGADSPEKMIKILSHLAHQRRTLFLCQLRSLKNE
ncbi:MAG: type II secretion system protein [Bdellovibrionota bacterium]